MAAPSFVNVCRYRPTAGGTTDWTFSVSITGYQSPALAGVVNGALYSYRAESSDLTQWEIGLGTYNTGTGVLARTTVRSNNLGTTAKINFTTPPQVALVALAEDLIFISPPQGRLTLQTLTPVMSTSQSAKTTIYYTPYVGNQIPLYDSSNFRNVVFAEISVATTDTAKSPAAIGASKVNDWFVWDDAGTTRIGHGPDWTNDTTRSAGAAIAMINGIMVNNVAITNGPAILRGTYVGTTRSNASSQLDWTLGLAAGGGAGFLNVWNMYNRRYVCTSASDGTATHTYTTATVRQSNASANSQINFVCGLAEDSLGGSVNQTITLTANVGSFVEIGIGLDSTTTRFKIGGCQSGVAVASQFQVSVLGSIDPQLGYHFVAALELGDGTHANTFIGQAYQSLVLGGMF